MKKLLLFSLVLGLKANDNLSSMQAVLAKNLKQENIIKIRAAFRACQTQENSEECFKNIASKIEEQAKLVENIGPSILGISKATEAEVEEIVNNEKQIANKDQTDVSDEIKFRRMIIDCFKKRGEEDCKFLKTQSSENKEIVMEEFLIKQIKSICKLSITLEKYLGTPKSDK